MTGIQQKGLDAAVLTQKTSTQEAEDEEQKKQEKVYKDSLHSIMDKVEKYLNEWKETTVVEKSLKELIELHKKYLKKEVQENLATGLYYTTIIYESKEKFTKMEKYLDELIELHKKLKVIQQEIQQERERKKINI